MKIFHVLNHFLPQHIAGTEVYAWALCKQLQIMGCDVQVIIPNYDSALTESYKYDDITVHQYAEPTKISRALITGKTSPVGIKNFVSLIKRDRPDIVHFHDIAGSNGIGVAHFEAVKNLAIKVVFTVHLSVNTCRTGSMIYKGQSICDGVMREKKCASCALLQKTNNYFKTGILSTISSLFYDVGINSMQWQNSLGTALSFPYQIFDLKEKFKRIVDACTIIIPITDWYQKVLLKNGVPEQKLVLIKQAIPTEPNIALPPRYEPGKPIKLVFIGRIDPLKGVDLLINVVKKFSPDQLELTLYGSAPENEFLLHIQRETKQNNNIKFAGKIKQEEVVPTLMQHHALVLPSMFSEMSPLVIQEAFKAGIPVIGSNVYGISEQVKDGVNGLLFEFGKANSLKGCLQAIIKDRDKLKVMSENILPPRNFEEVAMEVHAVYDQVLHSAPMFE